MPDAKPAIQPTPSKYSLRFNGHFSRRTWVSRYQNVSILDFVAAKGDGGDGDNCSYKTCKAPVKSSPTNQHSFVLQVGCPSCHPTNSVRALKGQVCNAELCDEFVRVK